MKSKPLQSLSCPSPRVSSHLQPTGPCTSPEPRRETLIVASAFSSRSVTREVICTPQRGVDCCSTQPAIQRAAGSAETWSHEGESYSTKQQGGRNLRWRCSPLTFFSSQTTDCRISHCCILRNKKKIAFSFLKKKSKKTLVSYFFCSMKSFSFLEAACSRHQSPCGQPHE